MADTFIDDLLLCFKLFAAAHTGSLREVTLVVYNQCNIFDAFAYDLERARA